jgi:uncharacterized membrane protein YkvA (DUF1232 family)
MMSSHHPRRKMDSILGLLTLHKTGQLFWRLVLDRRVPFTLKIYASCGLVYFFSPLDVVPHDFTGMGLLDDIIVALVIMQAMIEMAPPQVVDEHCERLGIDPKKAFLPVPVIIADAMDLFYERKRRRGREWEGPPSAGEQPAAGPPEPPPYARYSAFREDE